MSLQVWLPLNGSLENKGLADVTITNNNATVDSSGKIDQCYSFNGSNSKIVNILSSAVTSSVGTLCCWVKMNSLPGSFKFYNLLQLGSLGGYATCRLGIYIEFSNYINISIDGSGTGSNRYTHSLVANRWYHICATNNGTTVKLYIDGEEVLSKSSNKSSYTTAAPYLYVGGTSSYSLNGYMNDIRYYDNALSETEIKEIAKGLVLHLPLNNNGTILNWTEIGNLLPNSKTMGLGSANVSSGIWRVAGSNTMTRSRVLIKDSPIGECYSFQNSGIQTPNDGSCYGIDNTTYFEPNTEYKISMFARITSGADGYAGYNIYNISEELGGSHTTIQKYYRTTPLKTDGSWTYCWYHFKTNSSKTRNIYIGIVTGEVDVTTQMCLVRIDKWNDIMDSTIEYDSSGYNNNAVKYGNLTYSSDAPKYNVSTVFPTSGINYINLGTQLYNIKDAMTVSLWAKANDWASTSKGTPFSSVEGGGFGWQMSGANYVFYCGTGTTSNTYANSTITVNNLSAGWHMLSATYDGFVLKTYIDGVLATTLTKYTTKTPIYYNNNSAMFISGESAGSLTAPNGAIFRGSISDVRIYATALSEKDILSLYNNNAYIDSDGKIYGKIR